MPEHLKTKSGREQSAEGCLFRFLVAFVCLSFALLESGCIASSKKMNLLSIGMTKAEVISKLGTPSSSRAIKGTEYLVYNLAPAEAIFVDENHLPEYFVRIIDGKVDAYGKAGDFDSVKDKTPTLNVNVNR